jgi:hypothetical protein
MTIAITGNNNHGPIIDYNDITLSLTDQAVPTSAALDCPRRDTGQEYLSEWTAPAIGSDGNNYIVTWRFWTAKDEEPEDNSFDWDNADCVHMVKQL